MVRKSNNRTGRRAKRQKSFLNRLVWSLVGILFAFLTVVNVSNILRGDESLFLRAKLKNQITAVEQSIANLKEENRLKRARIELLKDDPDIIEEEARRRLNLVKEGEELFIFPNPDKK